jgi:polyisoprenoid-binding protein YceI
MRKLTIITLIASSAFLFSFKAVEPTTWSLNKDQSKLGFIVSNFLLARIEGDFKDFDAKITSKNNDFTDAVVEMTAEASSIFTNNKKRDKHLNTEAFFDAEKYIELTFKSTSFKMVGPKTYKVQGNLTMRGITKPVILDAHFNPGANSASKNSIAVFNISGKLKRSDFGIGKSYGSAYIGDEVAIIAYCEFEKE